MIYFNPRQRGYDHLAMYILDEMLRSMTPAERNRLLARVTQRLHTGAPVRTAWLWNAAEIAKSPNMQKFVEAAADIRATAETCIEAIASDCESIVIRTSGGLDSSIVASLAARATQARVTALHLVGHGYESYERRLARLCAAKAGIELVELEVTGPALDVDGMFGTPRTARPSRQILSRSVDRPLIAACQNVQADCIMTGHGGDGLFLQRSLTSNAFSDHLRLEGLRPSTSRVAYECASLLEESIWSVLTRGLSFCFGVKRWDPVGFLDDGLSAGLPPLDLDYLRHDWLEEARSLPPGKAEQLRSIVALSLYSPMLGHGLAFDAVNPLASQPMVEFALRTPAYRLIEGGADRSLERAAFADLLPPEILRRTQKGFINHGLQSDIAQMTTPVREVLLEGRLVNEGHVDRTLIELLLSDAHSVNDAELDTLVTMLAVEAWLISWRP